MRRMVMTGTVVLGLVMTSRAEGQAGVSFWVGAATASDSGASRLGTKGYYGGVQLGLPLMPVGVRVEALHSGTGFSQKHMSYMGSGVVQLRLALFQLYGLAGVGRFAVSDSTTKNGWHAGAGGRVGFGRLGAFLELRRIDPLARTVTTLGVTF